MQIREIKNLQGDEKKSLTILISLILGQNEICNISWLANSILS